MDTNWIQTHVYHMYIDCISHVLYLRKYDDIMMIYIDMIWDSYGDMEYIWMIYGIYIYGLYMVYLMYICIFAYYFHIIIILFALFLHYTCP